MKNRTSIFLAILSALIFSGCAGYSSDYDQYASAYIAHQQKASETVAQMSGTFSYAMNGISDPTARALYMILAQQQIVAISNAPFQMVKPTTWTDFWMRGWGTIESAVPFIGIGYVANQALKGAGHNNYVQADTITDSFNPVEAHITGSSQASMSLDYSRPTTTTTAAP